MMQLRVLLLLLAASCTSTGQRQDVHLAPNAPKDWPVSLTGGKPDEAAAKWRALVAPHVEKARATYPEAKKRYLAGLPPRHTFFVTTLIRDQQGHFENVFVVVDQIADEKVTGRIATQVNLVRGYRVGIPSAFPRPKSLTG